MNMHTKLICWNGNATGKRRFQVQVYIVIRDPEGRRPDRWAMMAAGPVRLTRATAVADAPSARTRAMTRAAEEQIRRQGAPHPGHASAWSDLSIVRRSV